MLNAGQIVDLLKSLVSQAEQPAPDQQGGAAPPPANEQQGGAAPPANEQQSQGAPPPALDYSQLAAAILNAQQAGGGQSAGGIDHARPPQTQAGSQAQADQAAAPPAGVNQQAPPPGRPAGAGALSGLLEQAAANRQPGEIDYTDEAQVKALIQRVGISSDEWRDKHHPRVAAAISAACDAAGGPANYFKQGQTYSLDKRL